MPAPRPLSRAIVMNDVAKAAGVHVTTVSLALRNSPQLPVGTRERIRKLADAMGYRVNPLLSALVQQRRTAHSRKFQGVLGFITRSTTRHELRANVYVSQMFAAAASYALELGFKLEPFELIDYAQNSARLEKALHARNIRGLFFPPSQDPGGGAIDLRWEHFACATLSTNLRHPVMDHIDTDHFGASRLAVQTCMERGYRRVGCVSLLSSDIASQGRWRGGYIAFASTQKRLASIPALVADDTEFESRFRRWHERWRPDVVISNNLALARYLPVLKAMNVSVPGQTAIVSVNLHQAGGEFSGVDVNIGHSSRQTIDQIVNRLHRNQLGPPEHPVVILTPPVWREGATLPPRTAARTESTR